MHTETETQKDRYTDRNRKHRNRRREDAGPKPSTNVHLGPQEARASPSGEQEGRAEDGRQSGWPTEWLQGGGPLPKPGRRVGAHNRKGEGPKSRGPPPPLPPGIAMLSRPTKRGFCPQMGEALTLKQANTLSHQAGQGLPGPRGVPRAGVRSPPGPWSG